MEKKLYIIIKIQSATKTNSSQKVKKRDEMTVSLRKLEHIEAPVREVGLCPGKCIFLTFLKMTIAD